MPIRRELTAEAVRLTRVLAGLLPDDTEVRGLLALMLLHDSRRAARVDACGELVPLERQDRSLWDRDGIAEGLSVLEDALLRRRPGPYQVQAAVAACHATASDAADTDWPQIALLYRELAKWSPGPVVELNRAVAVAMSEGPEHGLALVEGLAAAGELTGYFPLYATRADLLQPARTVGRGGGRVPRGGRAGTDGRGAAPSRAAPRGGGGTGWARTRAVTCGSLPTPAGRATSSRPSPPWARTS